MKLPEVLPKHQEAAQDEFDCFLYADLKHLEALHKNDLLEAAAWMDRGALSLRMLNDFKEAKKKEDERVIAKYKQDPQVLIDISIKGLRV